MNGTLSVRSLYTDFVFNSRFVGKNNVFVGCGQTFSLKILIGAHFCVQNSHKVQTA